MRKRLLLLMIGIGAGVAAAFSPFSIVSNQRGAIIAPRYSLAHANGTCVTCAGAQCTSVQWNAFQKCYPGGPFGCTVSVSCY